MQIAVIGANGQLGSDLAEIFREEGLEVAGLTHSDIEIKSRESVQETLKSLNPDLIINTAGNFNVEKCETEVPDAFLGNAIGAKHVAEAAAEIGSYLIHISTDYVFDGAKKAPYTEADLPMPLNVYANSKLSGEYFVRAIAPKSLIMRTCGLYGKNPCRAKGGRNFVETMLNLAKTKDALRVVDHEVLTPTFTKEVAYQILAISKDPVYGLCHATAEGECSWYEFAKAIFTIMDWDINLNKAAPDEFPTSVNRPAYSVLSNKVLQDQGLNTFRHWKEGLRDYLLKERANTQNASDQP